MANAPNGVETLTKISIALVGSTNVTDRQTDGRRHMTYTFAKNRYDAPSCIVGKKENTTKT